MRRASSWKGTKLIAAIAAVTLLGAACTTDQATDGDGEGGGATLEALPGFVPIVDGEPDLGCGGYGFRPQNKDFRDAFNEALVEMKENGEIVPLVEEFGFTEAAQAAEGVTMEDLAPDAIEGESGGGLLEELQAEGSITIGFADEPPYGFEGPDGLPTGEAPTVAREVLGRLGIDEIDSQIVEFGALINGLIAGNYDLIAAGMFINDERAEQILFTDPDYCGTTSLAVKAGNPFNLSDFDSVAANPDVRFGLQSGTAEVGYAEAAGIPDSQIQTFATAADLFDALVADRVDAVALTTLTVNDQVDAING